MALRAPKPATRLGSAVPQRVALCYWRYCYRQSASSGDFDGPKGLECGPDRPRKRVWER